MALKELYKKYSFKNVNIEASGLIIPTQQQLDDLHKALLGIMDDVFLVCKENNLICMLSGGSALGALRNHGFIPWDDDADINMPRSSYNKFIPLFKEKYGDEYWIQTPEDDPKYGLLLSRIRKKGTKIKGREDLVDDSEAGAYVDIFIIENMPSNRLLRDIHGAACIFTKFCTSCRRFYRDRKLMLKVTASNKETEQVSRIRLIIGFLCSFMSVDRWTSLSNRLFSLCKNDNSKYVNIPAGRWHYFGEVNERKKFLKTRNMHFEDREYPVSLGVKNNMIQLYGKNFMDIPPEEKREKHMFWAFDLGDINK